METFTGRKKLIVRAGNSTTAVLPSREFIWKEPQYVKQLTLYWKQLDTFLCVSFKVTPVLTAKQKFPEYFEKHLQISYLFIPAFIAERLTMFSGTAVGNQRSL